MAQRLPITIRLQQFEGPLDLLLYLIQSHELDISRISVSQVTDQYLSLIRLMNELDFTMASEFLLMAATLIQWKSKSLLPKEGDGVVGKGAEDEDDILTPEQLVKQLQERQRFLKASDELSQQPILGLDVFTRDNLKPPVERVWKSMNQSQLVLAYQATIARSRKQTTVLKKETVSVAKRILEFREQLVLGEMNELRKMMSEHPDRPEWVASLLASLELSKLKKLKLHQHQVYGPVFLELLESLENFSPELSVEFY